jgi:hypothetical protein
VFCVDEQAHVHELIREENIVGIVENRLEPIGAGGGIDLIVDGEQFARGNLFGIVAVKGFDGKLNSGTQLGIDLGKLVLRQAEEHGDRLKLSDEHQAIDVGGVHNIAGVNQTEADTTADGRSDVGKGELQFGVVNLALVRGDRAIKLANQCRLRVELLLRDDAFLEEELEALKIDLGILALRLILGELALGLFELDLKGPRVNLDEKIPLLNVLTFLKRHVDDLTVHAAANGYRVICVDVSQSVEVNGKIAMMRRGNDDGNDKIAASGATTAPS